MIRPRCYKSYKAGGGEGVLVLFGFFGGVFFPLS